MDYNQYNKLIGMRESSGDYSAENSLGYLGKYQYGADALYDLGIVKRKPRGITNKEWLGNPDNWVGDNSKESFLNNPDLQESLQVKWNETLDKRAKHYGMDKYYGQEIDGITITPEGFRAGSHLIGSKALSDAIKKGSLKGLQDAYGTKVGQYVSMFQPTQEIGSMDVPSVPGMSTAHAGDTKMAEIPYKDPIKVFEDLKNRGYTKEQILQAYGNFTNPPSGVGTKHYSPGGQKMLPMSQEHRDALDEAFATNWQTAPEIDWVEPGTYVREPVTRGPAVRTARVWESPSDTGPSMPASSPFGTNPIGPNTGLVNPFGPGGEYYQEPMRQEPDRSPRTYTESDSVRVGRDGLPGYLRKGEETNTPMPQTGTEMLGDWKGKVDELMPGKYEPDPNTPAGDSDYEKSIGGNPQTAEQQRQKILADAQNNTSASMFDSDWFDIPSFKQEDGRKDMMFNTLGAFAGYYLGKRLMGGSADEARMGGMQMAAQMFGTQMNRSFRNDQRDKLLEMGYDKGTIQQWIMNGDYKALKSVNELNPYLKNKYATTWRDDVLGEDGRPYQVQYDGFGKEIQRVPKYVAQKANKEQEEAKKVASASYSKGTSALERINHAINMDWTHTTGGVGSGFLKKNADGEWIEDYSLGDTIVGFNRDKVAANRSMFNELSSENFMTGIKGMEGFGSLSNAEGSRVATLVADLNSATISESEFRNKLQQIKVSIQRMIEASRVAMEQDGKPLNAKQDADIKAMYPMYGEPKQETPTNQSGRTINLTPAAMAVMKDIK